MIELYNFAQSTCSLKVRICLAEKGIDWIDRRLLSKNEDHLSDWYLKLNPNGVVPTLLHDGVPVVESSVILQYLEEVFPEPPLMPAAPLDRAALRAWLAFVDHIPTPAVRYPSFQYGGLMQKFQQMSPEELAAAAKRRPLKEAFYTKMANGGFSDEEIARSLDDIHKTAARMETMLEAGGPWLLGDYSLGDIAVAPLIDRMEDLGFAHLWEDFPRVANWLARMQARSAYVTSYYHGSRLSEQYPELNLGRASRREIPVAKVA
jgi:glutathione S-transferase